MLSKTFYRNSPTSKAIQPSHAAAADLNNAIEHLQRILKLDTPPRDPLTNATAAPPSDTTNHINACVTALQNLKLRLERHALLLTRIAQARTQIAQTSRDTSSRTIDMEQNTIAVQSQLTGILEEKESLMRELLVVRHDLEETDSSSDSEIQSYESAQPRRLTSVNGSAISSKGATTTISDISPVSPNYTNPLSTRSQPADTLTPRWDDSLDDDA